MSKREIKAAKFVILVPVDNTNDADLSNAFKSCGTWAEIETGRELTSTHDAMKWLEKSRCLGRVRIAGVRDVNTTVKTVEHVQARYVD